MLIGIANDLFPTTEAVAAFEVRYRETGESGYLQAVEIWWTWSGSNRRPLPCHGSALPAAPQAHDSGTLLSGAGDIVILADCS